MYSVEFKLWSVESGVQSVACKAKVRIGDVEREACGVKCAV